MNDCCFYREIGCSILNVDSCPAKCSFAKTAEEYERARNAVAKILHKKGLRPCVVTRTDHKCYVSTEPIPNREVGGNGETL